MSHALLDAVVGCLLISLCISNKWTSVLFLKANSPDYTLYFETLMLVNSVFTIFIDVQHIYTRVSV